MIQEITDEEKDAIAQMEKGNPYWATFKRKLQRDYSKTAEFVINNGGEVERGQAQYIGHLLDEIEKAVKLHRGQPQ